jgi:hypothetical protein
VPKRAGTPFAKLKPKQNAYAQGEKLMKKVSLSALFILLSVFSMSQASGKGVQLSIGDAVIDKPEGVEFKIDKEKKTIQHCDRSAGECYRLAREWGAKWLDAQPSESCDRYTPVLCTFHFE